MEDVKHESREFHIQFIEYKYLVQRVTYIKRNKLDSYYALYRELNRDCCNTCLRILNDIGWTMNTAYIV